MAVSTVFLAVSAGSAIYSGVMNNAAAKKEAAIRKAQARLIRVENNAAADRYARQAKGFKAQQSVKYLKSGVLLEGSPLDILDETSRVAEENISAMRASGEMKAGQYESAADQALSAGRMALIGGVMSAATSSLGYYARGQQMGLYGSPSAPTAPTSTGFNASATQDVFDTRFK